MNTLHYVLSMSAAVLLNGAAITHCYAQPPMGGGMGRMSPPSFNEWDANGDGLLTHTEFEQGRAQRIAARSQQGYQMRGLAHAPDFAALDQNHDGNLTPHEFALGQAQQHR